MKRILLFVILIALIAVFYATKKSSQHVVLPDTEEVAGVSESKGQELTEVPQNTTKTTDQNSKEAPSSFSTRNIFKNDGLELSLRFEDSTITPEEAQRITDDINHVFSHLHAKIEQESGEKYLAFEGKGRTWPDALGLFWPIQDEADGKFYVFQTPSQPHIEKLLIFLNKIKLIKMR